jgi:hypothetical protein
VLEPDHCSRYSARQRVSIGAELVGASAPGARAGTPARGAVSSRSGADARPHAATGARRSRNPGSRDRAGTGAFAVGLLAWAAARRWRRSRWPIYALGRVPFLVVLFLFFEAFSELLPAGN